jgi:hypothetical protein
LILPRLVIIIFLLVVTAKLAYSQEETGIAVPGRILDGDTIPLVNLREFRVFAWRISDPSEERRLTKLMKNVRIAYPYARLAGIKLLEYEQVLAQAPNDRARRQIMKKVEDEIEAEYGSELRELTISQGKILLKLIDRETGNSSYDLVSDMRGEFRAVFYQGFARLFGYNLKVKYDPLGEDKDIEKIVRMIENGEL